MVIRKRGRARVLLTWYIVIKCVKAMKTAEKSRVRKREGFCGKCARRVRKMRYAWSMAYPNQEALAMYDGLRHCQMPASVNVGVKRSKFNRYGATGIQRCNNRNVCPACAPRLRQIVADRWNAIVSHLQSQGNDVLFCVMTFSHKKGEDYETVLNDLGEAWRDFYSSNYGRKVLKGCAWARSLDVTVGKNGIHPHYNLLIGLPKGTDKIEFERNLRAGWYHYAKRDVVEQGVKIAVVPKGEAAGAMTAYTAGVPHTESASEWHAGAEAARLDVKKGKGLTPFQLLDSDRDESLLEWVEVATALYRKRMFSESKLWREAAEELGLDEMEEQLKLEMAEDEYEQPLVVFEGRVWMEKNDEITAILDEFNEMAAAIENSTNSEMDLQLLDMSLVEKLEENLCFW